MLGMVEYTVEVGYMGFVSSIYARGTKGLDDEERKLRKLAKVFGTFKKREAYGDYAKVKQRRHREFSTEQLKEIRNATARLQRKESIPYKTARVRCENEMRRKVAGPTRQERELDEAVDKLEQALALPTHGY
jgi:hypothetical protein